MLDKNYSVIIHNQDIGNNQNGQIWYLLHHPVLKKDNSIDIRSMFAPVNIHRVLGRGWPVKGDCFYYDLNMNANFFFG